LKVDTTDAFESRTPYNLLHAQPLRSHSPRLPTTTTTMSKAGAYGSTGGGDTDFRKTWDREEMAVKAKEREAREREEAKERYEAKAAGKTYRRRASTPEDLRQTEARAERIDWSKMVGKQTLTSAAAAVGKRGKGAGAYCAPCDLTFKDNIQYIEHLNSKQHLVATGQSGEVKRATLEEVRERLRYLKRKADEAKRDEVVDVDARLALGRERMEAEAEERRRKRNEKRRAKKKGDDNAMQWTGVGADGVIA
jgi:U4/U6.U5 tri-snRNP component SNU23